jgi:hypothetical protein
MNLFDELVKDAQADIESGKFLNSGNNIIPEDQEKMIDEIEKKMNEKIDKKLNEISTNSAGGDNDNKPKNENSENNDESEETQND